MTPTQSPDALAVKVVVVPPTVTFTLALGAALPPTVTLPFDATRPLGGTVTLGAAGSVASIGSTTEKSTSSEGPPVLPPAVWVTVMLWSPLASTSVGVAVPSAAEYGP